MAPKLALDLQDPALLQAGMMPKAEYALMSFVMTQNTSLYWLWFCFCFCKPAIACASYHELEVITLAGHLSCMAMMHKHGVM